MTQISEYKISHALEPICPRDEHRMRFEPKGISWKALPDDREFETMPSYHCNYESCSVRYDPANGYFTVVLTPDQPYFIEEPGVNLLRCPRHGAWLYKTKTEHREGDHRFDWRCGVEGCDYILPDPVHT
jgi:hypothetical protein